MKTTRIKWAGLLLTGLLLLCSADLFAEKVRYYYQIKVYHLQNKVQEEVLDDYLQQAYLPALHRFGLDRIGVFKPLKTDPGEQLVYVLIPFRKIEQYLNVDHALAKDQTYLDAGKAYLNASYDQAPFTRIESILLKSFSAMPEPKIPALTAPKAERVYELRSYEANTEQLSLNKIGMFNDAEVKMFSDLDFNAVFYGQVISGSRMPNLMYLTTFNNKEDREKHWAAFGPVYQKISGLPQYQHNVSKNVTLFLYPTDYSDI